MKHIKYDKNNNIIFISKDMLLTYKRGLVSPCLSKSITKFLTK